MRAVLDSWPGRIGVVVLIVLAVAFVKGFADAGHNDSSPPKSCAILASGNKLCGDDLAAYCQEFVQQPSGSGQFLDLNTVDACSSVGVDVTK